MATGATALAMSMMWVGGAYAGSAKVTLGGETYEIDTATCDGG